MVGHEVDLDVSMAKWCLSGAPGPPGWVGVVIGLIVLRVWNSWCSQCTTSQAMISFIRSEGTAITDHLHLLTSV